MDKNIAAGEISGQGWQKMYFGLMKEKAELRELYEKDIVGFLRSCTASWEWSFRKAGRSRKSS